MAGSFTATFPQSAYGSSIGEISRLHSLTPPEGVLSVNA